MADSILTALASNTMLIFEGPPGIGKTEIAMSIFNYLNIDKKRINLSPSTTKEDIFSRIIPIVDGKKIKTDTKKGELLDILEKRKIHKFIQMELF